MTRSRAGQLVGALPPPGSEGGIVVGGGVVGTVAVPVGEVVPVDVDDVPDVLSRGGVVVRAVVVDGAVVRDGTLVAGAGCTPPFEVPVVEAPDTAVSGRT